MKKLLIILTSISVISTSSSAVISCDKSDDSKGTVTKKSLTSIKGNDLKLSPTSNDESAAKKAVINKIKSYLSIEVKETTDIIFKDFISATLDNGGSIKVSAVETSTKITGESTFNLIYKEEASPEPTEKIDLQNLEYKNIPAGVRTDGVFDSVNASYLGEDDKYDINEESILFSLNQMNSLNLKSGEDFTISELNKGEKGIGGSVIITATNDSKYIKGSTTLTFNKDILFSGLLKNRNIDKVYVNNDTVNNIESYITNNDYKFGFGSLIMEAIGVKNPALETFSSKLAIAGMNIIAKCELSKNEFIVTEVPQLDGIFKAERNVKFNITFVEDKRAFIKKGENNVTLDKGTSESSDNYYLSLKKAVYSKVSADFRTKVSESEFVKYTRITKSKDNYSVVLLPGSDIMYSHDRMVPLVASKLILSNSEITIQATIQK
ncbi:lipoprotein [Spiroplasma turonicum]|uniref:Lipoprotein n=1 Tax=Spiroplasma turonicum TaxID=216946 RepID=A0A0K1P653_9MOLU|nr:lipoprotein [Spiroplasma turonicum]AKU79793.1 hypothetical protein STURON_00547 [Spiroplasma turonicum]ALX70811.1 hypothetical protein STURO_v1c05450 [Spiroplasma turonicum]